MITFLEGLPRSGKSYSAMKESIIPALKEGRKVFSNVEGLEHGKVAALVGISIPRCCELLIQLTREQMPNVYEHVQNDALIVLDEVQDYWPTGRQKLSPQMTEFITQHGHRGLDIIIMGQSIKDVHALWRRRVERKNYFLKLSALGKPDRYSVTFFNAVLRGEDVVYEQIQSMQYDYDPAFFGTYKSHTDETKNKSTSVETRAVVWNTPIFKKWVPIFGVLLLCAVGYLVWFMSGGIAGGLAKKPPAVATITDGPQPDASKLRGAGGYAPVVSSSPVAQPVPSAPSLPVPVAVPDSGLLDPVESLNKIGRIRFSGYVRVGSNIKGFVEWRDAGMNLLQHMTFLDLSGLGYVVMTNQTGTVATITKGATTITALAWPIDRAAGRASETDQARISGHPRDRAATPGQQQEVAATL